MSKILNYHYVYALIDPRNQVPFYIGKGTKDRVTHHFSFGSNDTEIFNEADSEKSNKKESLIKDIFNEGYNKRDIARVLATRITEPQSFLLESVLIHHIYGLNNLTNLASGRRAHQIRPFEKNWNHIDNLDLSFKPNGELTSKIEQSKPYVYALVDPETNTPFYIGKGIGNRLTNHFKTRTSDPKSEKLFSILKNHEPKDIGRIIAWTDTEEDAFCLEAFYIKFLFKNYDVTNRVAGHGIARFRAKNDWEIRDGLDIPVVVEPRAKRSYLLDQFIGEGVDEPLLATIEALKEKCNLEFSELFLHGAGELTTKAKIKNKTCIFIYARTSGRIQCQLNPTSEEEKRWTSSFFKKINKEDYPRKDGRFTPPIWKFPKNMTLSPKEAARRAKLLIDLTHAENPADVDNNPELNQLFPTLK